ncbi:TPR-like protein [Glarea lozoyensis ATCC 20868]|uniref:TPR-like protein n=1 Tax=Glarea lozoyensis (strain ATCC 20868 / MF5171) TaxID=1116229 RepID=S3E5J8_GLAL2|nr:TPR-like protein [Glarea lozoyensis ATCC 20868]EPE33663.1 TPR-like protein [Glarea lozoyensis ATCC 20868]
MKLEKLPDDFEGSLNISSPQDETPIPGPDLLTQAMNAYSSLTPPTTLEDGTTGPQVPPGMAAMRNKSTTEILAELNKSPLFMTELEANDDLEALKALAYEGTPAEVAGGFKERGNECFQVKGWGDAKEFYTKGIQVLLLEVRKRQTGKGEETDSAEVKKEVGILEASLVNRAACHLELKNYRQCVLDCGSALKINGRNVKAYYRSAKALLALGKIEEADDACAKGLSVDEGNVALKGVAREIIKKNEEITRRKKIEAEREQKTRLELVTLRAALKARGIKTRKTAQPPEMEDAKIQLTPDPTDPTSTISFPTILLYPLHLESDFIKAFNELEPISHHLSYILPLPWDLKHEYTPANVECYIETTTGGLLKVGKKATLLKVLTAENVEVVDEVVKIFVVPKAKAPAWIQEFKTKKGAEKKMG